MSTAKGDRISDIEGTPMGGGPVKGAAELTGGYLNYCFIVFNLVVAWVLWFCLLGTLSAFQNRINNNQDVGVDTWHYSGEFGSYAIDGGYPALQPGRLLRFEWFLFFLIPIILGVVSLALFGRIVRQTRSTLTGYMTVLLILTLYSTNRVYDLSHFSKGTFHKVSAGTFGVFVGIDISLFGLIYLLGLEF